MFGARNFLFTGLYTPPPTIEYLVVGGGGGGAGSNWNGSDTLTGPGAGGGGYRTATGYVITPGSSIVVTVGVGGTAGLGGYPSGIQTNGGNSVFGSITSLGGGYGSVDGGSGGSGGGCVGTNRSIGLGTAGQGFNGATGTGIYGGTSCGGGPGGGAGGAGSGGGGSAGPGLASSISGSSVTYAAGYTGGPYVAGQGNPGATGAPNTGNGGGGGSGNSAGGAGGSGIVIIRYNSLYDAAPVVTGSPTITVTGGYRIYKWTTVGTWSILL